MVCARFALPSFARDYRYVTPGADSRFSAEYLDPVFTQTSFVIIAQPTIPMFVLLFYDVSPSSTRMHVHSFSVEACLLYYRPVDITITCTNVACCVAPGLPVDKCHTRFSLPC